jgi:hypothetical protein
VLLNLKGEGARLHSSASEAIRAIVLHRYLDETRIAALEGSFGRFVAFRENSCCQARAFREDDGAVSTNPEARE